MSLQLLGKTLKPMGQTFILPKDGNILKAYSLDIQKNTTKVFKNYNIYIYCYNTYEKRYFIDCNKVTSKSNKYIFLFKHGRKLYLMGYKEKGYKEKIIFSINDPIIQNINVYYAEQCMEELPFSKDVFSIIGSYAPKKTRLLSRRIKKITDPHYYAIQTINYATLSNRVKHNYGKSIHKLIKYEGDSKELVKYFPNLTHLTMNSEFNKFIILPSTLTHLTMGYNFNSSITIPKSLTHLTMGDKFDSSITIPKSLTHLTMGHYFNNKITIPKSLTHLTIGDNYRHPIDLHNNITHLTVWWGSGWGYKNNIDTKLPNNLIYLNISNLDWVKNKILPNSIKTLIIRETIYYKLKLPNKLINLTAYFSYPFDTPRSLQCLDMSRHWKDKSMITFLPRMHRNLTKLILPHTYYPHRDKVRFTPNLKYLYWNYYGIGKDKKKPDIYVSKHTRVYVVDIPKNKIHRYSR